MDNEIISIRKLRMEEFDRLKPLFPDSDEKWDGYRRSRLEQFSRHDADTYIMEASGACIGELSANYSSRTLAEETIPQQRVYLDTFRLAEAYQGAGLGQRLLRYALDDLEARGFTEFTIGVEEENEIARHIYSKFGFTVPVAQGHGSLYDPCDYTLYLRKTN